ncbi:MAG TPA: hypothetical protein VIW24_15280 [Aldersonia sp.]
MRALSGVVTGGLIVLAAVVIGAAVLGDERGFPGPGAESIGWHLVAVAVAVGAQVYADRHRGMSSVVASLVVLVVAGLLLWTQWWS